jgi:hypothetical protein
MSASIIEQQIYSVFGEMQKFGDFYIFLVTDVADVLAIGDWRLAIGDWRLAVGDWRLAIGDWRLAISYWLLALGDWLLAIGFCEFLCLL